MAVMMVIVAVAQQEGADQIDAKPEHSHRDRLGITNRHWMHQSQYAFVGDLNGDHPENQRAGKSRENIPAKSAAPPPGAIGQGAPRPQQPVDVEAVLNKLKSDKHANLDWEHSIVDLMKLLDLDSSLAARKELAQELGYKGALDGSAEMNVWLHKQVMAKLAEGGGKVPDSLKD